MQDATKEPKMFKKKPVSIRAMKWTGKNIDEITVFSKGDAFLDGDELVIKTLEDGKTGKAKHVASVEDYIIEGVHGEFYFCKPDIFEETYEDA